MTQSSDLAVHFSSASNEWYTPRWLFDRLNAEFSFDLDVAATPASALCKRFYTAEDDALKHDWAVDGSTIWCNPPYGRLGPRFIAYGSNQTQKNPSLTTVFLVPARPDTKVWHEHCAQGEVRFLKGRLRFDRGGGGSSDPAPFPSALVVFGAKAKPGITLYVDYRA